MPALTEGVHTAVITGTDPVGNSTTDSGNITVDLTPPQTPSSAPDLQPSSDSGTSDTDNITNITTPVFNVLCTENNSVVTLYIDHTDYTTTSCTTPGTVEITMTSALEDGVHHITYRETDAARNISPPSPALTITVLANPPTPRITIDPITDDNIINITELAAPITVTGTVSNVIDGDTITITLNDQNYTTQVTSGTFTHSIPGSEFLADSSRTITTSITTHDIAGNTTTGTRARTYEVNTSVPGAPSAPRLQSSSDSGSSDTDNITNITTPVFDVFCSKEDSMITLNIDDAAHTTLQSTTTGIVAIQTTTALTDGNYAVTYTEKDSVGNESNHSLKLQIKIRTTPPTLSLIGSDHIDIPLHTPFTGVGARATNTLGEDFSQLITLSGSIDIHTPGTYILTYSVTDLAGNAATPITRTITVHDAIEEEPIQQDPEMSDVAVGAPACTKTKPGKPKNITVNSTTDSRILVAFKKASGDVDRYQMKYGKTPDAHDKKIKNIHKERRDYIINDLTPGTTYYIKVRAVNECVQGSWSRAIKITTPASDDNNNIRKTPIDSQRPSNTDLRALQAASPAPHSS